MDRQTLRYIHIGGHGRKIVPILDACVHSVRKIGRDLCATSLTLARIPAVFGYNKR